MCIMAHLKVTERLSEPTTGAVYCCSISHVCIVVLYGFDSCVGACHCSAGSHSGFKSVSPFGFCAAKRVMSEEPVPKKPRVEDNPSVGASSSGSDGSRLDEAAVRSDFVNFLKQTILLDKIQRAIASGNPMDPGSTLAEIERMLSNQSESEDEAVAGKNRIILPKEQVATLW